MQTRVRLKMGGYPQDGNFNGISGVPSFETTPNHPQNSWHMSKLGGASELMWIMNQSIIYMYHKFHEIPLGQQTSQQQSQQKSGQKISKVPSHIQKSEKKPSSKAVLIIRIGFQHGRRLGAEPAVRPDLCPVAGEEARRMALKRSGGFKGQWIHENIGISWGFSHPNLG